MKREQQILAVLVVVSVIVGILIYYPRPDVFEWGEFEWAVEVDEIYQFEVNVWGDAPWGNLNTSELDEIRSLNETMVNVTITYLPPLDNITDVTSFEDDIVTIPKISCRFANGSDLPANSMYRIIEAVSGCILPNGSWSTMDSYHPTFNEPEWGTNRQYFYSDLLEDTFQFGFIWIGPYDDAGGWNGTISLDSGLPSRVTWWYNHQGRVIHLELILSEVV